LFAAGWALMYWSLGVSYALTVLLAIPEACVLIRLFIVHHDCGHGSFFRSKQPADVVGSFLGRRACASCRRPPPGHLTVVSERQRPIPNVLKLVLACVLCLAVIVGAVVLARRLF
jgi:hypothetical protein